MYLSSMDRQRNINSDNNQKSNITLKVILKKYVLWMKMLTKRSMIEEITAQINDIEGEIFDAKEEIATQINDPTPAEESSIIEEQNILMLMNNDLIKIIMGFLFL
ncbi:hypothetical protein RhiirA4_537261 [Rhizophagus irregularis]|uniref:Uncharacterized protein n=1 Tax=Rhizophagus irregularis TaxID=588596 RepID=A0A2I1FVI1_9GLOM|nr:hypothetical protein RhiirA4_537261 [Rhizophagus irregularis]